LVEVWASALPQRRYDRLATPVFFGVIFMVVVQTYERLNFGCELPVFCMHFTI
jgi:hypothetical protein